MIIVTGASQGLGLAICNRLSSAGVSVLGLARNVAGLPFLAMPCDVTNYEQMQNIAKGLQRDKTQVFGLINAAGTAAMNLALTTPPEVTQRVITTNLMGTIYSCQLFTPLLVRNKRGRIINFSTIAVALGLPGESIYAASKAGVEAFSRSFAREVGGFGITVNCIAPGPIATNLLNGISAEQVTAVVDRQIIKQQYSPGAVCDLVELLLQDNSAALTGQVLHVGGA